MIQKTKKYTRCFLAIFLEITFFKKKFSVIFSTTYISMTSLRHQDYKNENTNGGQQKLRKPKLKNQSKDK